MRAHRRCACLLVFGAMVLTEVNGQPRRPDPVPADELQATLRGFLRDLGEQTGALTPPRIVLNANDTSAPGHVEPRADAFVNDFRRANRAPIEASLFNVRTLDAIVRRADLDALAAAVREAKGYEATTLAGLRNEEASLLAKESLVFQQIADVHRTEQATIDKYFRLLTLPDSPVRDEYRRAMDAVQKPLPGLYERLKAIDAQDEEIAGRYTRKVFTFEIPPRYVGENAVEPLVDGSVVFPRVARLLNQVATRANGKGYVHISLWECAVNTPIDGQQTFSDGVKGVAAAGNEVAILLWYAGSLARRTDQFGKVTEQNEGCKQRLEQLGPRVHVQLVEHPAVAGSYHEKTFVFFDGTQVHAIVGGLNVSPDEVAAPPHRNPKGTWTDVHDVAVEVVGPATRDVEHDFTNRWYIDRHAPRIMGPGPTVATGPSSVSIALTRPAAYLSEYPAGMLPADYWQKTSIREELLQRIDAAERYAYFENYAVHEETLVAALGQRVAAAKRAGRTFLPIVTVYNGENPYKWLHFITYQHLSFMGCDAFTYTAKDGSRHTVDRKLAGKNTWRVGPYEGRFYEKTKVYWDGGEADLIDVDSFTPDTPLYTLVYLGPGSPATPKPVPIHAKVAIFDDAYAGIGSANFNPRSLRTDGELTAFFRGPAAADFRRKLWSEYEARGAVDAEHWRATAEYNKANLDSLKRDVVYVLPLHRLDLSTVKAGDEFWRQADGAVQTLKELLNDATNY